MHCIAIIYVAGFTGSTLVSMLRLIPVLAPLAERDPRYGGPYLPSNRSNDIR